MPTPLRSLAATALAAAFALSTPADAQTRSDTRVYAGVSVSFGAQPEPGFGAIVGLQSTRLRPSGRMRGIDIHGRYDFLRGFDRVAVAGLIGRRNGYLNLGGGYNPLSGEVFVTGAAQAQNIRAGLDYGVLTGTSAGYFELNTLRRLGRYVPPPTNGGSDDGVPGI